LRKIATILGMVVVIYACQKDRSTFVDHEFKKQFQTPEMLYPFDNPQNNTSIKLGKYLFFNPAMSLDSSVSCASCHNPSLAFSDHIALSIGSKKQEGTSNAPTLGNIGFHPYFTRAGGVPSLEIQTLVPIQEENEFNHNLIDLEQRLKSDSFFVQAAREAYPNRPHYFAITASIAAFERTLISNQSKFDGFISGRNALSPSEVSGMRLFFSNKAKCASCHSGFNFTNYAFEANGATILRKDSGRYRLTKKTSDIGLFKVPTLRNIAVTGPFMHDGSYLSLYDVLRSYNQGGKHKSYQNSKSIQPLNLSNTELSNLEAFLNTLTDFNFLKNPNLKKP